MGKIVAFSGLSLDGFIEGPDHDISWHMVDEEFHVDVNEYLRTVGAYFQGRRTHELMVDFWPHADEDPSNPPLIREYAGIWREKPKYVFSTTIDTTEWNTTVVREVDPDYIAELKGQYDADIVIGGADLAATFMRLDLIDEYRFYLNPVVIGAGKPFFPGGVKVDLTLAEARPFGNGVVLLRYERQAG
jgi:dihydrofolate reductase